MMDGMKDGPARRVAQVLDESLMPTIDSGVVRGLDVIFAVPSSGEVLEQYHLSFESGELGDILKVAGEALQGSPNRQINLMMRKLLIISNMLRPLCGDVVVSFSIDYKKGAVPEDWEPPHCEPGSLSVYLGDDDAVDWDIGHANVDGAHIGMRFRGLHDMVDPDRMQEEEGDENEHSNQSSPPPPSETQKKKNKKKKKITKKIQ
jgi:hypothetical protein